MAAYARPWYVQSLRGWLGFIAFNNLCTAARCFIDEGFLKAKIFDAKKSSFNVLNDIPEMSRLFGCWTAFVGINLLHCAIFLRNRPIISMTVCSLLLYMTYIIVETFVYKTLALYGVVLFNITLSGLSLLFLLVSYRYIQRPIYVDEIEEDLMKAKFPLKKMGRKSR